MYPNKKSLKVYETMCTVPNRWIDVMEVARLTDLTSKQVATAVKCFPEGNIRKEWHDGLLQIRLDGTQEELDRNLMEFRAQALDITEEMRSKVRKTLTCDSWTTVTRICESTGMNRADVFHTLQVMGEVNMKYTGKSYLCRRKEEESDV